MRRFNEIFAKWANFGRLFIDHTEVTSTAAELNALDGNTATAAELSKLADVTAGTAAASKAAVLGANKELDEVHAEAFYIGAGAGMQVTANAAELNAINIIEETVAYGDFTDGGAAVGTYDLLTTIPAGATFLYTAIPAVTGFAGDVSAGLTLGDGTDVDRYNTGSIDVFSNAAAGISAGAPSGVVYHDTEATVKLTITTNADFSSVSAGSVTVKLYYLN